MVFDSFSFKGEQYLIISGASAIAEVDPALLEIAAAFVGITAGYKVRLGDAAQVINVLSMALCGWSCDNLQAQISACDPTSSKSFWPRR
jgi:hypothetical protein